MITTVYKSLPEGAKFSDKFPTWIIAFCPDTNSFFATNQRYFYWEHDKEFESEKSAIDYFYENLGEFVGYHKELKQWNFNHLWFEKPDGPYKIEY